jgi:hypothetical protein
MTVAQMFHAMAPAKRSMRMNQVAAFEDRAKHRKEQWIAARMGGA